MYRIATNNNFHRLIATVSETLAELGRAILVTTSASGIQVWLGCPVAGMSSRVQCVAWHHMR